MTKQHWLTFVLLGATCAALAACRGGSSSETGGGSAALMTLDEMSNGFGRLVPHTIGVYDLRPKLIENAGHFTFA